MTQKIFLPFWTLLILIPFLHARVFRSSGSLWLAELFRSNLSHVAAHLFLFVVFAWLLAAVLERKGCRRRTLGNTVLWAVLALGTSQEILQGIAVGGFLGLDQVLDVAVDLIGGLIGLVLYGVTSSGRMRRLWPTQH